MWLFDLETFLVGEPDMTRTIDKQTLDAANARFKAFTDLHKSHFGESPDDYTMEAYQSGNCYASYRQVNYWKGRLADAIVDIDSDNVSKANRAQADADRAEIYIPMFSIMLQADMSVYESIAGSTWEPRKATGPANVNRKVTSQRMAKLKEMAKIA